MQESITLYKHTHKEWMQEFIYNYFYIHLIQVFLDNIPKILLTCCGLDYMERYNNNSNKLLPLNNNNNNNNIYKKDATPIKVLHMLLHIYIYACMYIWMYTCYMYVHVAFNTRSSCI